MHLIAWLIERVLEKAIFLNTLAALQPAKMFHPNLLVKFSL